MHIDTSSSMLCVLHWTRERNISSSYHSTWCCVNLCYKLYTHSCLMILKFLFFISFCSSTCIFCSDHGGKCYSCHSQWYACGCSCYCIWCYSNYSCSSGPYVISIITIYYLTKIVETAALVLRWNESFSSLSPLAFDNQNEWKIIWFCSLVTNA